MSHAITRTSPFGGPFIGRCIKCGAEGLGVGAPLEDCPADGIVSDERVLMDMLLPPSADYVVGLEAAMRYYADDKNGNDGWTADQSVAIAALAARPASPDTLTRISLADLEGYGSTTQLASPNTWVTDAMVLEIWGLAQQYDDFDAVFRAKIRAIIEGGQDRG